MIRQLVYLIRFHEGRYKIGRSADPEGRLGQLDPLGLGMELLHTIESSSASWLERYLHARFESKQIAGEWFTLSEDDVAWIRSLDRLDPPIVRLSLHTFTLDGLGRRIQEVREGKGMTQPGLAAAAGLPLGSLKNYEQGIRLPNLLAALLLAEALGVTVNELVGDAHKKGGKTAKRPRGRPPQGDRLRKSVPGEEAADEPA